MFFLHKAFKRFLHDEPFDNQVGAVKDAFEFAFTSNSTLRNTLMDMCGVLDNAHNVNLDKFVYECMRKHVPEVDVQATIDWILLLRAKTAMKDDEVSGHSYACFMCANEFTPALFFMMKHKGPLHAKCGDGGCALQHVTQTCMQTCTPAMAIDCVHATMKAIIMNSPLQEGE